MSQIKAIDGKIEIIFVQKLLFSKSCDWLKFVPLWALRVISLLRSRRVALGERAKADINLGASPRHRAYGYTASS
jgi:hypothetical protein